MNGPRKIALAFGLVAVTAIGVVGYNFLFASPDPEERAIVACEEALKTRLRSPSTYNRISVTPMRREPTTIEVYLGTDTEQGRIQVEESAAQSVEYRQALDARRQLFERTPMEMAHFIIEYDAQNAFGAPVRDWARCDDFIPVGVDLSETSFFDPRINGRTATGWLLEDLQSL